MRKKMHKMMFGYKNKPMRKGCVMQVSILTVTILSPPPPPQAFALKCVPSPGLLHNRKCPGAGPINDDVPGAGHLQQLAFKHENR